MADFIVPTILITVWICIRALIRDIDSDPDMRLFTIRMPIVWLALVVSGLAIDTWGNNYVVSSGSAVGAITDFAREGLAWKTWEGQIALEGLMSDGSHSHANVHRFSIDSQGRHGEDVEGLAKRIAEIAATGGKVRLTYLTTLSGWTWRGSTDVYVQSVEPVGK